MADVGKFNIPNREREDRAVTGRVVLKYGRARWRRRRERERGIRGISVIQGQPPGPRIKDRVSGCQKGSRNPRIIYPSLCSRILILGELITYCLSIRDHPSKREKFNVHTFRIFSHRTVCYHGETRGNGSWERRGKKERESRRKY